MTEASGTRRCLNCDTDLSGPFCSHCGQEDQAVRVSMRQLVRDFLAEQLGLESKVGKTFWALVSKPGFLTTEYLAGRRARWVLPLKLYLSASVIYFLLLTLPIFGSMQSQLNYTDNDRAEIDSGRLPQDSVAGASITATDTLTAGIEGLLEKRVRRFNAMSEVERVSYFQSAFSRYMPNAIFVLLPFFTLLLYWLYRSTGRFYAEHLIFTLHVHSFAFAAMIVTLVLPDVLEFVAPLWIITYLFLAMRRVYAEPRGRTAVKFAGLAIPYMIALLAATMGVLFLIFAFG